MQEVTDLNVGITIVAVLHLTALPKQRIGFVEQQDGAASLRRVEHPPQVLFRFADVLAHHLAQVDAIQIQPQLVGQHLRRHGLARAAGTRKQHANTQTSRAFVLKAPRLIDLHSLPHVHRDLSQDTQPGLGQYQIIPGGHRLDALGQVLQARASLLPTEAP